MLPGFTLGSLQAYAAVALPQVLSSVIIIISITITIVIIITISAEKNPIHCAHCSQIFLDTWFQLMNPNSTGILIDIYQASWIGDFLRLSLSKFIIYSNVSHVSDNLVIWWHHFSDNNPAYKGGWNTEHCSVTGGVMQIYLEKKVWTKKMKRKIMYCCQLHKILVISSP